MLLCSFFAKGQVQSQSQATLYLVNPTIYGATTSGQLIRYDHPGFTTGQDIPAGKTIGQGGWQYYQSVFANGNVIYAVTTDGKLNWYKYDGFQNGTAEITGAKTIGKSGWDAYKSVFGGGSGIIYAITKDGNLVWYKYTDEQNGNAELIANRVVGRGGWDQFRLVFSGGNGVIYAVGMDDNLYWYKHLGVQTGEANWEAGGQKKITTGGWQLYKFMFSGGEGIIYAVGYDGNLYWYKHDGFKTGAATTFSTKSRRKIGTGGWSDFLYIFCGKK